MTAWTDFWKWADTSLGSNVVGSLIVAGILAGIGLIFTVAKSSWREKVWGNMARLLHWVRSLRVTTQARTAAALEAARLYGYRQGEMWGEQQLVVTPLGPDGPPLPLPRWTLTLDTTRAELSYVLNNVVPRSIAREVRIENRAECPIMDAGSWEDLSGETSGRFFGAISNRGMMLGVNFEVSWHGEINEYRTSDVWLESRLLKLAASQVAARMFTAENPF